MLAPDITMWTDGGGKAKAAAGPSTAPKGGSVRHRHRLRHGAGAGPAIPRRRWWPAVLVTSAGKPYAFVSLAVVDGCIAAA